MIHGSMTHTPSGRKIKKVKPKGEVYGKYQPPAFRPIETTKPTRILSYAEQRREEVQCKNKFTAHVSKNVKGWISQHVKDDEKVQCVENCDQG